jgi:DNA-binding transcriptional MerR regulator
MIMATGSHALQIGEVAKLSALSVKTIRYYTDIGLLEPHVERSPTRYRLYSPEYWSDLHSFVALNPWG